MPELIHQESFLPTAINGLATRILALIPIKN
jgi:hypothetical protein